MNLRNSPFFLIEIDLQTLMFLGKRTTFVIPHHLPPPPPSFLLTGWVVDLTAAAGPCHRTKIISQ